MNPEAKLVMGIAVQIFFLIFMVGSGVWVAFDARKHGRPPREYIIWGIFAGWFVFLGLAFYLFWRKRFFHQ
jgi:O-antigen/teichoic acid export membrane protein